LPKATPAGEREGLAETGELLKIRLQCYRIIFRRDLHRVGEKGGRQPENQKSQGKEGSESLVRQLVASSGIEKAIGERW